MKKLLPVAAATVLAVAVMFFASSFNREIMPDITGPTASN
jgi:hypothetical protein